MAFINSGVLIKIGNPASILIKDDDELLIALEIIDPDVSLVLEKVDSPMPVEAKMEVQAEQKKAKRIKKPEPTPQVAKQE